MLHRSTNREVARKVSACHSWRHSTALVRRDSRRRFLRDVVAPGSPKDSEYARVHPRVRCANRNIESSRRPAIRLGDRLHRRASRRDSPTSGPKALGISGSRSKIIVALADLDQGEGAPVNTVSKMRHVDPSSSRRNRSFLKKWAFTMTRA